MGYETIRPAAYVPDPATGPFIGLFHTLAFPAQWRQPILDLCQHGRRNPEPYKQVPIGRLNAAIRAVAPDLVSVAERATLDDGKPWLYTDGDYPISVIGSLILSWLQTIQPAAGAFPHLQETYRRLDLKSLHWDAQAVDLSEQALTDGGTADPAAHLYRLLPEVLAARIEELGQREPYEYYGTQVSFRRVATGQGAELMSWPPSEYRPKAAKGRTARPWHFSAIIGITLQTVPFSPVPRIHLSTGIRRWVRGSLYIPDARGVTTYLLADGPWLADTERSARFAAAKIVWNKKERKPAWAVNGPEGILSRLTGVREFPDPDLLTEEAETWIDGRGGVTAAVTHHTTMGAHGVKPGLMPTERQRLTQWAAKALLPSLRPVADLERSDRKPKPRRVLKKLPSIPQPNADPEKAPDPANVARIIERRAEITASNARLRRERLGSAIGNSRVLTCHVLYQTDAVRDELVGAAERHLELRPFRADSSSPSTWVWRAPEVEVRIHALPLSALGAPLGAGTAPRRGSGHESAVDERRAAVREFLKALPDASQVVLVELDGKKSFRPRTDPKGAIRLGCADADRVSQFITPDRKAEPPADTEAAAEDENDKEGSLAHRADSAWADALRQVGTSFVPRHALGSTAIPEALNQLAFWIVRRNTGEASRNKQFTPVAVLIRPDQDTIMGRTPEMQTWVPYPALLKGLTGQVRGAELKTAEQQKAETARFVRQILYNLRGEPTVALVHAQNMRSRWEWVSNNRVIADKIQVGNGPVQELVLHGKNLRLIRLRDGDRNETPQWWAPDGDELAGQATGLWQEPDAGPASRVFYATTEKPGTHQDKLRDDTKLTPHFNAKAGKPVTNWARSAWNPTLLEITVAGCTADDDPEAWAMFAQQQRFADDYRDALKLPLVLHLAELAHEYALPYDTVDTEDPEIREQEENYEESGDPIAREDQQDPE